MTTKPKAKKFRIRRSAPTPTGGVGNPVNQAARSGSSAPRPASVAAERDHQMLRSGQVSSAHETRVDLDIDAIRKEGLTGRQLRMARRMAQKHGIAATSDFDAVRQLRAKGIDPFQRANMLELVVQDGQSKNRVTGEPKKTGGEPKQKGRVQLPQTIQTEKVQLPSTGLSPAEQRDRDISQIQRDIAARRRKKLLMLLTRLSAFVFLPAFLAGYYFYAVATPMYAAKSEFLILQADAQGGSGLGGLLSGTQFATNQDSIAVQSYLQSKDAMIRLDQDVGFKSHFTQDWIDPIQRLETNPTNEDAYKIFRKNIKIGYDPTEGVIRMEVAAAEPLMAAQFSERLISYAEERVDDLSRRKREDSMATARESLERAQIERRQAQEDLVKLQEGTLLDPEGEIGAIRSLITNVEAQLQEKELDLQTQLNNTRPNKSKVQGLETQVRLLKMELDRQKARLTEATENGLSLAEMSARIQMAQADLATADLFLQSALQNEKQTALEANRQVRYLTTSVRPVAPQDPSYPRAFENTILAFLIFSGIYLMISLTASILREQVTS